MTCFELENRENGDKAAKPMGISTTFPWIIQHQLASDLKLLEGILTGSYYLKADKSDRILKDNCDIQILKIPKSRNLQPKTMFMKDFVMSLVFSYLNSFYLIMKITVFLFTCLPSPRLSPLTFSLLLPLCFLILYFMLISEIFFLKNKIIVPISTLLTPST